MDIGSQIQHTNIDLHCHLDGSISIQTMEEILERKIRRDEVQVSDECPDLMTYLNCFMIPLNCMQTRRGLYLAAKGFLLDCAKQQLLYVEPRFAPMSCVNETQSCSAVIETVLRGLEDAKKECGVEYNVIICAMRHHSDAVNKELLHICKSYLGHGVCAMDLAGNEAAYPMELFIPLFSQAQKEGVPFTIHAGECGNADNIRNAVECGARRIGHGIAMMGRPEIQDLCRSYKIGIEMCPVSNYQTKAVSGKYPILEFLNAGLLVTVNTDNRTVSNTDLEKEYAFLRSLSVSEDQLILMKKNAAEVSFAPEPVKEKLRAAVEKLDKHSKSYYNY